MANRNTLVLLCGLFLSALIVPALQGGVYVPPGAGLGPGGAGPGTGFFPGSAGGGYKPAKVPVGGYGPGGQGVGGGGLVPRGVGPGGLGIGGLPTGQGGKAPKPDKVPSNPFGPDNTRSRFPSTATPSNITYQRILFNNMFRTLWKFALAGKT